ncbi:hypothetical protein VMCG_03344 [Cytospora schulzeri]|uniref:VOC domain-containing protein n=1 Tax=Cytospora schulzeri TaxID=448051 RepID=A0A423WW14_9PEZI|nr:hypothetical protein VMCG_03344 [Valsa malicola]
MPFDLDRTIDHQLYLATQKCLAPYLPGRSSIAITGSHGMTTSDGRSSLGSLLSPWAASLGSGSGSGSGVEEAGHTSVGNPPPTREDRSPCCSGVTAPVVVSGRSGRGVIDFETGAGRGVTARGVQTTRENTPVDVPVAVGGHDTLTNTVRPKSSSRPQLEKPQRPPPLLPPSPQLEPRVPQNPNQLPRIAAIDLLVDDLPAAKHFYRQVFSIEPTHEDESTAAFCFNDMSLMVNLYTSSRVGRVRDVGRRFQLSVAVGNVDEVYARLKRLVEGLTEPRLRPWGVRTVTFQDPSGYCWEVAEEVG